MAPPDRRPASAQTADPQPTAAGAPPQPPGEPFTDAPSLLDVLERLVDRGIVVEASARGALPALQVADGEAAIAVAAVELAGDAPDGWEALARAAAALDAPPRPPAADDAEAGRAVEERATLQRQLERLNA